MRRCLASVYDLGARHAKRLPATGAIVVSNRPVTGRALVITAPVARLKRGDGFLLVVRLATGRKLLFSTGGWVG